MIHKAKKSLGQNFLINPKVAERIALDADISKKDIVLEIGPGTGYLTKYLLARVKKVVAIEKDHELFKFLQNKFSDQIKLGSFVLVHDNVLDFDMSKTPFDINQYKIIANIPYNITGAILKKFLSEKNKPESMTLMIQKEVAERIIAKDGKESLLSISVKTYGEPKILFKVSRGNFYPSPNVDSAVIAIKNISRKIFVENEVNEEQFWGIVRAGFAHKRKKLSSNLKVLQNKSKMDGSLASVHLGNSRAEELKLADWINLVKSMDINKKE